jgi:aryl-alcohol dehydrogenase-like predicted oxidoreductase
MNFIRPLVNTGLQVSALGLGTVKFGRNSGVKYPSAFDLPDDNTIRNLLAVARELQINVLDPAPAYGSSEERIGQLLTSLHDWSLITKVGEDFDGTCSTFDFSAGHVRSSIERSLKRLRTDFLDLVLIHSNGDDEAILRESDCVPTLRELQKRGLIRAIGMSVKTDAGGELAAELLDAVMVTYNLQQQDVVAVAKAHSLGKGVLVKKGLMSGHVQAVAGSPPQDLVRDSMNAVLGNCAIHSMIVGTLDTTHLRRNVELALAALTSQR